MNFKLKCSQSMCEASFCLASYEREDKTLSVPFFSLAPTQKGQAQYRSSCANDMHVENRAGCDGEIAIPRLLPAISMRKLEK